MAGARVSGGWPWVAAGLAVLLLGASGGAWWRQRSGALAASTVAQAQVRDRVSQFALNPPGPRDTVMLGDSLTHEGEWTEWLGPGHLNRGLRGDRIETLRGRLTATLPRCPARVHLLIGINDLRGLAGSGLPQDAQRDQAAQQHAALVAALQAHCPAAAVRVQALLPVNCQQNQAVLRWPCPSGFVAHLAAFNAQLQAQAAQAGVEFVDLGATLRRPDGELDPAFSHDGLHLNGAGYRRWVQALQALPGGVR